MKRNEDEFTFVMEIIVYNIMFWMRHTSAWHVHILKTQYLGLKVTIYWVLRLCTYIFHHIVLIENVIYFGGTYLFEVWPNRIWLQLVANFYNIALKKQVGNLLFASSAYNRPDDTLYIPYLTNLFQISTKFGFHWNFSWTIINLPTS